MTPSPEARIGVPWAAAKSMPLWAFQLPEIGCTRIEKPDEIRENSSGDFRKPRLRALPSKV